MNDGQLRTLIHQAKTTCLPHQAPIEVLLWALATELEKRMPEQAPPPAPLEDEISDYAPSYPPAAITPFYGWESA